MSKNQLLKSLQSTARQDYANVTPGFAYVYVHNNQNGIRLEAPDIVLEFSNGVPLGRDPRGLLFYHAISDLKPDKDMQYKVSTERRSDANGILREEVLIIGIWTKGDSFTGSKPYAKFIAAIPSRAWGQTKAHEVVAGRWAGLIVAQATTIAYSVGNSPLVTLTIQSLKKKFEFNTGSAQEGNSTDCHGSLVVRDITQLTGTGIYVDYTNTRILIFRQQGDQHPIAVFSPLELHADEPLFDATFQVNNGRFSNI